MAWFRTSGDNGGSLKVKTASGNIASFETNLVAPLQSVLVDVLATGGNGTPDNPNHINGYTEANINANGITHTIAFGQTVYGGQLDVTRGKLHVTHGYLELDGTETYIDYSAGSHRFYIIVNDYIAPSTSVNSNFVCNRFVSYSKNDLATQTINGVCGGDATRPNIIFKHLDSNTVDDFKTWVTNNNIQLVYPLATPFDIDLTPKVIEAIVGENNVFADCGQTTVKYLKRE